ncbi:MAG TPA: response regulator transcription factor [Nocardioides sp.]|nr:response regulator transcription factor [Nocardioides sp.]
MLTIGLCEDDDAIRGVLVRALRAAGHDVTAAHDGREALRLLGREQPLDVIVMDVGLPDADGRDVVQALRSAGQDAPVLFLTALGASHEVLAGFAAGADDYVVKPFETKELLARLAALARRGRARPAAATGLVLDPLTHAVHFGAASAALTPTEFRMLAAITSRAGEVVRRSSVVAAAWPDGAVVSDNTVDSFVRRLRTKLDAVGSPQVIQTVRGVGCTLADRT